ncbi:ComEC/Rec2 family competence protein [Salipiger mucosus]|uniref:DNA internalization-related protein competence protein ComEC/Rec2 n=1 Tax=Salipiger mucosus DSM 16094 TaxID=1123237 RepID=S9QFI8_9RHOB|nr:ComEC/Rec2 family competence protein [Salipiger mucosus]EPX78383.1 DNA internalization-related protein competence protein ComEC/Rec2 [Salipiger mucosus DSM 16094]
MRAALNWVGAALVAQRGHLFPWVPVFLGCGIGLYFALPDEPPVWLLGLCTGLALVLMAAQRWASYMAAPLLIAAALLIGGFALAGGRAHWVAGPQLDFRYYGPVQGRVIDIDRSASDALRLTLDRVVLRRMAPAETPRRVRVSLHGRQGFLDPAPGQVVILTGHLSPPGGAVEPGGFDFRRHAWFLQLGAVGYTRTPVLLLEPAGGGQWVTRARMALSVHVRSRLPGETGAFAAAIMTGDRSGMAQETIEALRHTNLAHLLAISGLHMGLVAGFVFGAVRLLLLLPPHTRHHWPGKKIAAAVALLAAAGYLALSGGSIATERAFVMVAVMLTAVILDRRALSLRAVALAAIIVLTLRPEALLGPGFQMSFAATLGLVTVFGRLRDWGIERGLPGWARPILAVVVSSVTASLATAPIAMAHFNIVSHYGLLANLVSVPVMGTIAVPAAVVAALLLPLGLDWVPLHVMELGLRWILGVAHRLSDWEGAVGHVVAPPGWVLPMLAGGGLLLCLWQGRGRWAGIGPLVLALIAWTGTGRPDLLIADTGTLVGIMTPEGRALSRPRGAGFHAEIWLENDGQGGGQEAAAALWPEATEARTARAKLGPLRVVHLQGKRAMRRFEGCTTPAIVVSSVDMTAQPGCDIYDPARLRHTGAVALWLEDDAPRIITAAGHSQRLWHGTAARGQ